MDEPERAWRQLGLALDRLGFTVQDRDRSRGTFYVRYVDPEPAAGAKGLAQKVFGTGPKKDLRGKPYQIVLTRPDDQSGTVATVLDEAGKLPQSADDQRVAAQIVRLLHGQLR
jgi:outer membrane protein assembly factor BamC